MARESHDVPCKLHVCAAPGSAQAMVLRGWRCELREVGRSSESPLRARLASETLQQHRAALMRRLGSAGDVSHGNWSGVQGCERAQHANLWKLPINEDMAITQQQTAAANCGTDVRIRHRLSYTLYA